ncbi:6,7-dimethyl-8-ribityllumazine synthase [bacterium]|nr:6,7-dimethyl-8-ribityllumazine synthase [bacterium]
MKTTERTGQLNAKGMKFAIVVSRFNSFLSDSLLKGALDCLERHQAAEVEIVRVPGAYELPFAAKKVIEGNRTYNALICLGTIIRGATPHFDFIAAETTKGIAQVSLDSGLYISYGLITADTIEQAIERAGTKAGNKGFDAALAAIEMANVL